MSLYTAHSQPALQLRRRNVLIVFLRCGERRLFINDCDFLHFSQEISRGAFFFPKYFWNAVDSFFWRNRKFFDWWHLTSIFFRGGQIFLALIRPSRTFFRFFRTDRFEALLLVRVVRHARCPLEFTFLPQFPPLSASTAFLRSDVMFRRVHVWIEKASDSSCFQAFSLCWYRLARRAFVAKMKIEKLGFKGGFSRLFLVLVGWRACLSESGRLSDIARGLVFTVLVFALGEKS